MMMRIYSSTKVSIYLSIYLRLLVTLILYIFRSHEKENCMSDLFENVKMDNVLSILKEAVLYQKYDELKPFNQI